MSWCKEITNVFVSDDYFEAWVTGKEVDFDFYTVHLIYAQNQQLKKYIHPMAIFPVTFHA